MPFGRVSEFYLSRDVGGNAEHALLQWAIAESANQDFGFAFSPRRSLPKFRSVPPIAG
jgi:hypothetical protein